MKSFAKMLIKSMMKYDIVQVVVAASDRYPDLKIINMN